MGILYIVSTPIGNLKDITMRAIETLESVNYILCEDTRVTGRLLNEYKIEKRMVPLNDFNEKRMVSIVISDLQSNLNIALVSDAGTPLISDPGFKLVRAAIDVGICVESIPGPSAVIAALTVSGLPTDKFTFIGYLPKKDGKRKEILGKLREIRDILGLTYIIYESPYRVVKSLEAIKEVFRDIDIVVCRELTKMHEEVRREKVSALIDHFSKVTPKGEFVIVF